MHHFGIVLQIHFAVEGSVAPGIGVYDRLIIRMVAEILAIEVHFEVAATSESFQASSCR